MKKILFITFFLLVLLGALYVFALHRQPVPPAKAFLSLQTRLIRDGFHPAFISALFQDQRFSPSYAMLNDYPQRRFSYFQLYLWRDQILLFFSPEEDTFVSGKKFISEHPVLLKQVESTYHVNTEIMVAVLAVESRFGKRTGQYPVFDLLALLSVMDQPKSNWAYTELTYFLKYCQMNHVDPLSVKGSWAGAIGFCQFMPSSIFHYGVDGNRDGRIDLFSYSDALYSIANYLHRAGFNAHDSSTWPKALYAYNHSYAYVDAILNLAEKY